MNLTLKQLSYVKAAANHRSISRASEQLRVSQSSIGAAINRVEQEFNVRIFVRKPSKGLITTDVGRDLLVKIDNLLLEVDDFASYGTGVKTKLQGELNIGCFAPLSPHVIPPILRNLTRQHPEISVHLHEGHLQKVQTFLMDGTVDVVLTYDLGLSHRINSETLGEAPPHVILPIDDPLVDNAFITLPELVEKPMVLLNLPESRTYFEFIFTSIRKQPRISHRSDSYETVRSLVAAGLGFSLLNLRPIPDSTYTGDCVVCKPLLDEVRAPKFIIGRRRKDPPTQIIEAFCQCCREYFETPDAMKHVVSNQTQQR